MNDGERLRDDGAFGGFPIEGPEPLAEELTAHDPGATADSVPDDTESAEDQQPSTARYSNEQLGRARDVLGRLSGALRAARFYPLDHPAAREAVAALAQVAATYHDEAVDIAFTFYEGEILLGEQLLADESVAFDQLVRDLSARGAGSLILRRGASFPEYQQLALALGREAEELAADGGLDTVLRSAGVTHIQVGSVRAVERHGDDTEPTEEARTSYTGAISLLREIDRLTRGNRQISTGKIKSAAKSIVDNVLGNRHAMLQLSGLKDYDEYTYYHSANVAVLALALGSAITSDYRFLSSLATGALLHDVGKLTVDADIINKPGVLAPDEWAAMRRHPITGAQMVSHLPGMDRSAVVIVFEHHMHYDGTGYPSRPVPRRQHLASRIVAVADAYDAMTSRRSYSAARVQDEAVAMLARCAGSSLDPALVRTFIRVVGVYPPRSVVRLASGETAIVLEPGTYDPTRPLIRVIAEPGGEFMDPFDVDLASTNELVIQTCVDPRLLNIEVDDYVS